MPNRADSELYWENAWLALDHQMAAADENTRQTVDHWEKRAASFARNTTGGKNVLRQRQVLQFLEESGGQIAGGKILDIGSGPGNYAVMMAEKAEHIWALDPSPAMLAALRERMAVREIRNITTVEKTWQEIDLDAENWRQKFDIVFAAMTPGINSRETLQKMIAASRGYCLLSKFAGPRQNNLHEKLWRKIDGGDFPGSSADFIYPFNLLYQWGYYPAVKFFTAAYCNENTPAETEELLQAWLEQYRPVTPALKLEIQELVREETDNGLVREMVSSRSGVMVWKC